jgi:hypothetical protein
MQESPAQFAELLTLAVRRIKAVENKTIEIIQDELGYLVGHAGHSFITYLRKGHVPSDQGALEKLTTALWQRHGLTVDECVRFLRYGGHPHPADATAELTAGPQHGSRAQPANDHPPPLDDELFVAGPPITQPRQFFGRERELARIFTWWRRAPLHQITVVGPRRSGKTSLLHYLAKITVAPPATLRPGQRQDWLPTPTHYDWVQIDFQDARMRKQQGLLSHLLRSLGLPIPEPCTLDRCMDVLTDYPWSRPTIVLMDELSAGLQAPELDQEFWWSLRALLSHVTEGNLAFLVAAHASPETLAADADKSSPFFNVFNQIDLGPLTEAEARALIGHSPLPFPAADVDWILAQSGRWPALLQQLCQERFYALERDERDAGWQAEGLRRIAPLRYLLEQRTPENTT